MYTLSSTKFQVNCTNCVLFLATCNQNICFHLVKYWWPDIPEQIGRRVKLVHSIFECVHAK